MLELDFTTEDVRNGVVFLEEFPPSTKDVTVEVDAADNPDGMQTTLVTEGLCEELEQTLLRFPRPRIQFLVRILRATNSFWTQELRRRFPALFQRKAFTITGQIGA